MALWKERSIAAYLRKRGCTKKVQPRLYCQSVFPPSILLYDMDIALRERNFYMVLVQNIIDGFFHLAVHPELVLHQHPVYYIQVDAVITKILESNRYTLVRQN